MPTKVIAKFEREAITHLEALRRDRAKQIERDQGAELKRIRDGYTAQIDEAASEDRVRLRRALNSEEKRLGRQPDVRSRAKLLAVTLDEDDWLVEETWQGPSGRERSISYEWGLGDPPEVDSDASQQPIRVLALCSEDHFVDASENTHCPSCDSDRCDACGEDAVLADCLVCGADSCGACRSTTGGLCLRCGAPERAPEFDRDHSVAWRLNGGVILHVGERVAELVHSDAAVSATIAHDDDVADRGRTQMRAYAKANGLPLDSGLVLRELFGSADVTEPPLDVVELRSDRTVSVELTTASAASSAIANAALPHLPKHSTASVHRAREFGLEGVLERLRRDAPPPAPPAVMITRRAQLTTYHLERDRVVERHATVDDGDRLVVRAERQVPLGWHAPSLDDPTFATAQIGRQHVSIERRNEALLVTSKDSLTRTRRQWVATPEATTAALQFDWFYVLSELGNSGGRMGKRRTEPAAMADCFPSPTECALGDRSIEQVVELTSASADMDLVPADKSMLPPIDQLSTESRKDVPTALPPALAHALLERSSQPFTTAALGGFEVHETWVGHGTAEHRYEAFDAQPLAPYLDDTGARSDDFGVCRDGHYYASGSAARCASCDTWACRTCDEQDHQASIECGTCSAQVCRRCLSAEHAVSPTRCVLCNDAACADCGRDPVVDACTLCARPMCDGCRRGNLCPACNEFTPASDEFLRTLPSELAALGATALTGSDDHATTLLMNRNGGIEQAVLRAGAVERWVAFGRNELGSSYKLRIAASREFRCRIVHSERHTAPEPPMRVPRLTIQSERRFRADWEVAELQRSGHGSGLFADVAGDLADAVLGDFSSGALPVPVPETPAEVPSALAKLAHPRTLVLETHWTRVGFDCSIVGEGILRREIDGADVRESTTPWGTHGAEPTWIGREWNPAPTVIRWASIDGADVAVVKLASLLAIGVHTGDYTAWYRIISSRDAPAATALARSNGLPDADAVTVFTDPVRITRSTVSNAVDADLTVQPAIKFSSRPVDPGPTTERAITAWVPDARVAVPLLIKLPNNLRTELTRVLQPNGVVVTSIEIGAMVKEVVTVQSGQIWQYDAHLSPGEHDARRKDSKTRVARDDGILDREGHYGADDTHCPYCADAVCALCQNGLRTCDCCGVTICRICLREPQQDLWLCPACAGVRPPTRAEAREHGRLMLTRGMLIGTDDKHVVVVERSKQNWVRHGDDGTKHPLASPSLVHYFGERLS